MESSKKENRLSEISEKFYEHIDSFLGKEKITYGDIFDTLLCFLFHQIANAFDKFSEFDGSVFEELLNTQKPTLPMLMNLHDEMLLYFSLVQLKIIRELFVMEREKAKDFLKTVQKH